MAGFPNDRCDDSNAVILGDIWKQTSRPFLKPMHGYVVFIFRFSIEIICNREQFLLKMYFLTHDVNFGFSCCRGNVTFMVMVMSK